MNQVDRANSSNSREFFILIFICIIWLGVNLWTASRSPMVWQDEVQCTDSIINYISGKGFTTTALPFQTHDRTLPWIAMLHTAGVFVMIKLFGFNPTAVRATNYVYMLISLTLLYAAMKRSGFLRDWRSRIAFALLFLCSSALAFSYRSGRYDIIGIVCLSVGVFGLTCRPAMRTLFLALSGLMCAWAGLQVYPLALLVALGLFLVYGRQVILPAVAFGAGAIAGLLSIYLVFSAAGIWDLFKNALKSLAPSDNRFHRTIAALICKDPTNWALLISLLLLGLANVKRKSSLIRGTVILGAAAFVLIPATIAFTGRFPVYYNWMVTLPLIFCLLRVVDSLWREPSQPWVLRGCMFLILVACVVGWPARMLNVVRQWGQRDYHQVERFVADNVRSNDWIYSNPQPFYALKSLPDQAVFFEYYHPQLSDYERARINVALIGKDKLEETIDRLGGSWTLVAEMRGKYPVNGVSEYKLACYRRTDLVHDAASSQK